jgi:hypothetical protein
MSATDTITLNVQASGGTCRLSTSAIYVMRAPSSPGTTIVRTTLHNDADSVRVYNVTSSNAAFTATKLTPALCTTLGFPPALCPASGGFDEAINPGANKEIYTIVTTSAASGGTVLRFDAESTSGACGSSSRCSVTADLNILGGVTCVISPPYLRMLPREIGAYGLGCQDLAGAGTACIGDNWASTPNLGGAFLSRSNSGATFYSTAAAGTSGTLTYVSDNPGMDIARCNSTLDIVNKEDIPNNTTMSCDFLPPRADMTFSEAKYFELHCMLNATIPVTPSSANYSLINGLGGTTGNMTVNGVTYTAPGAASIGDLRGAGQAQVRPNVIGAVALARINVSNIQTPVNCNIVPSALDLGQFEYGTFTVTCLSAGGAAVPCEGENWTWVNVSGDFVSGQKDNTHAWAYPTSSPPAAGLLTYVSGQAACNSSITVVPPRFRCEFNPATVRMDLNRQQYFSLLAYDLRGASPARITPTGVQYALIDGLGGSHSNDSTDGTLYQSPNTNTSGRLEGAAALNTGLANVGGVVCHAPIIVANGTGNNTDRGGSSQWCTIFGPGSLYPGYIGWVTILCGPAANAACTSVNWGGSGAWILSSTNGGAFINVTAASGTQGYISAYVDGDPKHSCSLPFYSGSRECVDIS